jgi:hypothetical protein
MRDAEQKGRRLPLYDYVKPEHRLRGDEHPNRLRPERVPRGETHPHAKLTAEQVIAIRAQLKDKTLAQLGREYGVIFQTIWSIKARKSWKHLP